MKNFNAAEYLNNLITFEIKGKGEADKPRKVNLSEITVNQMCGPYSYQVNSIKATKNMSAKQMEYVSNYLDELINQPAKIKNPDNFFGQFDEKGVIRFLNTVKENFLVEIYKRGNAVKDIDVNNYLTNNLATAPYKAFEAYFNRSDKNQISFFYHKDNIKKLLEAKNDCKDDIARGYTNMHTGPNGCRSIIYKQTEPSIQDVVYDFVCTEEKNPVALATYLKMSEKPRTFFQKVFGAKPVRDGGKSEFDNARSMIENGFGKKEFDVIKKTLADGTPLASDNIKITINELIKGKAKNVQPEVEKKESINAIKKGMGENPGGLAAPIPPVIE